MTKLKNDCDSNQTTDSNIATENGLHIFVHVLLCVIDLAILLFEKDYVVFLEHAIPSLMVVQHKIVVVYIVVYFSCIHFIHTYRNCIHHVCDCKQNSLYKLLSILYPPPQYVHITATSHDTLSTHHYTPTKSAASK